MTRSAAPAGRQRPGGSFGPARDEARDARIIDAVLDLIVEKGYVDLTMGAVAARAGVAKATVYRRWASREDLVADALETLMLPAVPAEARDTGALRDDLIATLTHSTACLHPHGRRFSLVLTAATASHPGIADTLRERYIAGQRNGIASCLHLAQQRGELTAERVEHFLAPDRLEIAAAIGLMVMPEDLLGAELDRQGIARVVDQVLMPLVRGTSAD
ncbi:TetR-like C-terminal domain-containing protein [Nocardioides korecus]